MLYYSKLGYEIFLPLDATPRVDFMTIKDGVSLKVQVKSAAKRRNKNVVYTVAILTTSRNGVVAPYTPEEVDEFIIVDEEYAWVIPNIEVYPRTTVMLAANTESYTPSHGYDVESWKKIL